MSAVVFALVAALAYGASDFIGGVLSASRSSWTVATVSQFAAAAVTAVVALLVPGQPHPVDLAWATGGGVGGGVGIAALYQGLARGRMGVVAPISGVGATLLPVAVGVAAGDQPSSVAWVGIALAVPAVLLIPRSPARGPASDDCARSDFGSVLTGVVAGVGFGVQFAFVGQIGADAGFFPLAVLWVVATLAVVLAATVLRRPWWPRRGGRLLPVLAFGPVGAVALLAFLVATGQGLLTLVSVIAALYPAVTVALAASVLRERIGRLQALGLALAVGAVVLVTIGG